MFKRKQLGWLALVLLVALLATACTTPRQRPDTGQNNNQNQGTTNRSGSGDTGSSVADSMGMAGVIPMVNIVRSINPKLNDYEEIDETPPIDRPNANTRGNNGNDNNNNNNNDNTADNGQMAGLRYLAPRDGKPGIRLIVNGANQVVAVQVVKNTADNRATGQSNSRQGNGTGNGGNGMENSEIIYLVDPDNLAGTGNNTGNDANTGNGNNANDTNNGRNNNVNTNDNGVAVSMTLENIKRWNPSLSNLNKAVDYIPGIGEVYTTGLQDTFAILTDKQQRVTGVKANFADVEWQPWFDQLPYEVVVRNPESAERVERQGGDNVNQGNNRAGNNNANVRSNTTGAYYTQHILFVDPSKIR